MHMEYLQVPPARPQRRRRLSLPENILHGHTLRPAAQSKRRLSDLSTILEVLPSSCHDGAEKSCTEDTRASCLSANTDTAATLDDRKLTKGATSTTAPSQPAGSFASLVRSVSLSSVSLKPRRPRRLSLSSISSSIAASLSAMASGTDVQTPLHHPAPSSLSSQHRNAPLKSAMRSPPSTAASLDAVTDSMSSLRSSHTASSDDKASLTSSSAATSHVQPVVPSIAATTSSSSSTSQGHSNRRRSSHGAYVARVSFDDTNSTGGGGGTGFDQSYTLRATTSGFVRTRESRTFLVATDLNAYSMHALNWCIDSLIEGELCM